MSWKSRQIGATKACMIAAAATLVGTPLLGAISSPFGQTVALLQTGKLTEWVSTGEVLRPLGVSLFATTAFTVTSPALQLQKAATGIAQAYAAASSGGVVAATGLIGLGSGIYFPFTTYLSAAGASLFTADAAGDSWGVKVTTSPTAGAANAILHYANILVAGISDAVTTL